MVKVKSAHRIWKTYKQHWSHRIDDWYIQLSTDIQETSDPSEYFSTRVFRYSNTVFQNTRTHSNFSTNFKYKIEYSWVFLRVFLGGGVFQQRILVSINIVHVQFQLQCIFQFSGRGQLCTQTQDNLDRLFVWTFRFTPVQFLPFVAMALKKKILWIVAMCICW